MSALNFWRRSPRRSMSFFLLLFKNNKKVLECSGDKKKRERKGVVIGFSSASSFFFSSSSTLPSSTKYFRWGPSPVIVPLWSNGRSFFVSSLSLSLFLSFSFIFIFIRSFSFYCETLEISTAGVPGEGSTAPHMDPPTPWLNDEASEHQRRCSGCEESARDSRDGVPGVGVHGPPPVYLDSQEYGVAQSNG